MRTEDWKDNRMEKLNEKSRKYDITFIYFNIYWSSLAFVFPILNNVLKDTSFYTIFQLVAVFSIVGIPAFFLLLGKRKEELDLVLKARFNISSSKKLSYPAMKYHLFILFSCNLVPAMILINFSFNPLIIITLLVLDCAIFVVFSEIILKIDYASHVLNQKKEKDNL